jgi:hypothetical protein
MITSAIETSSVPSTVWTDARIVVVRSLTTVMAMPLGIDAFSDGSCA